jgi:hypothetical protein
VLEGFNIRECPRSAVCTSVLAYVLRTLLDAETASMVLVEGRRALLMMLIIDNNNML